MGCKGEFLYPSVCDRHPELGYVGCPGVRRKLGLVLAYLVFELVAGASGLAVFMADFDCDAKSRCASSDARLGTRQGFAEGTQLRSGIHSFRCSHVERTYLGSNVPEVARISRNIRASPKRSALDSLAAGRDHLGACVE